MGPVPRALHDQRAARRGQQRGGASRRHRLRRPADDGRRPSGGAGARSCRCRSGPRELAHAARLNHPPPFRIRHAKSAVRPRPDPSRRRLYLRPEHRNPSPRRAPLTSNQELVWYPRVVPTAVCGILRAPSCRLKPARLQALREVRPAGIEPAACGLKDRCSLAPRREPLTTELRARTLPASAWPLPAP